MHECMHTQCPQVSVPFQILKQILMQELQDIPIDDDYLLAKNMGKLYH